MKIIAVIPARYQSKRLPGKALADIAGKPMIQWVWERVSLSSLVSSVLVATDDKLIYDCVTDFGGSVVMTPDNMISGTDRIAHVIQNMDADIVVNIQGDEPFIEPDEVDQVATILVKDKNAVMGTLVKRISNIDELADSNVVKVVMDQDRYALYFSRSTIPFMQDVNNQVELSKNVVCFKHIGIYSFTKDFLLRFSNNGPTPIEKLEKLEQLRALEMGCRIKTEETRFEPVGVDTPADLDKARLLAEKIMDTERT